MARDSRSAKGLNDMNMAAFPYVSVSRSDMDGFKRTLNIPVVLDRLKTTVLAHARGTSVNTRPAMGAGGGFHPMHYSLKQDLRPRWYVEQAAFQALYFVDKVISACACFP